MVQPASHRASEMLATVSLRFIGLAASSAIAVAALPTAARAQAGAIYGGAGGEYFEFACGPGQVLVGLRGSAGVLIDSAQAVCAQVGGNDTFGASAQGPVFGNDRPFDQGIECPPGYAVTQASLARNESNPHLGSIRLTCTQLANRADGGATSIRMRGGGNLEGYQSAFGLIGSSEGGEPGISNCPGQYAVGIRGRDGGYLTAFGLICGPKPTPAADPTAGRTLGKRKRPPAAPQAIGQHSIDDASSTVNLPAAVQPRTLGKRKRRVPAPPPADQPGASISSDSAPPAQEREAPSPLIGGSYNTNVSITESQCLGRDLRGSWIRTLQVDPQPGIVIPLHEYNSFFAGPVVLYVEGLRLAQSTQIPVNFNSGVSDVPATFDGNFTADAGQFEVRFQAGMALCRVRGTIFGVKT